MSGFDRRDFFLLCTAAAGAMLTTTVTTGCGSSDPNAPATPGLPPGGYFDQLASDLTAGGFGTPQILIDLDRLDANADAIAGDIGRDRYRIVEKSLPSLDLLGYVSARTGSNHFMVLHLPFLPPLLAAFPAADVLVAKAQPINAVKRFFDTVAVNDLAATAARVRFVVDSRPRLDELVALAGTLGVTLQVCVEIDAGLHRSGVRRPSDLPPVLAGFVANPSAVRFAGLLGYDGHILGSPAAPGIEKKAVLAAYQSVEKIFRDSVSVILTGFASLWRDDLIFDSGGSQTYPLHHGGVVNDVAAGGGMLRPASYNDMFIDALKPAIFIAAPVIAQFAKLELPFVNDVGQTLSDGTQSLTIYGGGWAAEFVHPNGLALAPLVNDPENMNLVPNQTLLTASSDTKISPGDWVFQHPRVADAIFQFENILLVRGGRLQSASWRAYPRRY